MAKLWFLMVISATLMFQACSGDNDNSQEPNQPTLDFSAITAVVDAFIVNDMAVMIGDANGVLYTYEKGNFSVDTQVHIASANKWLTGATIWTLVESGLLAPDDHPQDYIGYWTDDAADARSRITLDMLLGLTSGFNNSPIRTQCIGSPDFSLSECVARLYAGGTDSEPGSEYWYGPEHFQIAALMASEAMGGQDFRQIMRDQLFASAGMSLSTIYDEVNNDNARYSGSIMSTAWDYSKFLRAMLAGELIDGMGEFTRDRTGSIGNGEVTFGFRPSGVDENNLDWHYAFGFWIECDVVPFDISCTENPTISSPGAFGFTPWIDFERGYWGIIAMEGGNDGDSNAEPFRASYESVALEQQLQVLIETILD